MADLDKTEQPTPRRRRKAQEQGQVARSRDLSAALALGGTVVGLAWQAPSAVQAWRDFLATVLDVGVRGECRLTAPLMQLTLRTTCLCLAPSVGLGWMLATAGSLAQGGLVFVPALLSPNPERLNPAVKLKQLFSSTTLAGLLKALLPFAAILYCSALVLARDWRILCAASTLPQGAILHLLASHALEILWHAVLILLLWAGLDYFFVWRKLQSELRMSREEIRQETKESEGHPQIKMRIRRLQRQVRRRRMVQDVARATVVVSDPAHYAPRPGDR